MKVLFSLLFCTFFFENDKQTHYEVECGASAQWLNGKKSCSIYDESVFLTAYDQTDFENITVFNIKLQNIGTDTIQVLPKDFYITRVYANGSLDSVSICNPETHIQKADAEIARCEKEINSIIKANNTENAAVNIVRSIPLANKINTNTQASKAIYTEKLRSAQNKLLDAKAEKQVWESQALRANTIQPMSFIEGDIFFEANNCMKVILHIKLNDKNFDFLINQVSE